MKLVTTIHLALLIGLSNLGAASIISSEGSPFTIHTTSFTFPDPLESGESANFNMLVSDSGTYTLTALVKFDLKGDQYATPVEYWRTTYQLTGGQDYEVTLRNKPGNSDDYWFTGVALEPQGLAVPNVPRLIEDTNNPAYAGHEGQFWVEGASPIGGGHGDFGWLTTPATNIPEPSSILLTLLGSVALITRRHK